MRKPKAIVGLPNRDPFVPPLYEAADVGAIQALQRGSANEYQQQRALAYIVNVLAATYDQPFRPGVEGARSTDFACGRMFVGQQIVKLTKLNLPNIKGEASEQG